MSQPQQIKLENVAKKIQFESYLSNQGQKMYLQANACCLSKQKSCDYARTAHYKEV